jgi:immune inhibitor A
MRVSVPRPITFYAQDRGVGPFNADINTSTLFAHVANALRNKNLSAYDNDNDGKVDELIIIASGAQDQASGGAGRSSFWSLNWPEGSFGSFQVGTGSNVKSIDNILMLSEFDSTPSTRMQIGTVAHELLHSFGAPDLYDLRQPSSLQDSGIGNWGVMAHGFNLPSSNPGSRPVHPSVFVKAKLGWVTPVRKITHGRGTPNKAVKLVISAFSKIRGVFSPGNPYKCSAKPNSKEYFLLENRQKKGFDSSLPASGLLVWHVNENETDNNSGNPNGSRLLTLLQADGRNNLQFRRRNRANNNNGDAGDPYGNGIFYSGLITNLDANTSPSSKLFNNSDSGFKLQNTRNNRSRVSNRSPVSTTYSCKSFNFFLFLPILLISIFRKKI